MAHYDISLKKEAEDLEKKAFLAKKSRNYPEAISFFEKAIMLYQQIGFSGQIGILKKEISRLTSLMSFLGKDSSATSSSSPLNSSSNSNEDNETFTSANKPQPIDRKRIIDLEKEASAVESRIKNLRNSGDLHALLKEYSLLQKLYEILGYTYQLRKINFQIHRIKRDLEFEKEEQESPLYSEKTKVLEIAEKFASTDKDSTMQKTSSFQKRFNTPIKSLSERMKERQSQFSQKVSQGVKSRLAIFEAKKKGVELSYLEKERILKEQRARELQKKQEEEKRKLDEANHLLDLAKASVDRKDYDNAKDYYRKAARAFDELGWTQQAQMLLREIDNVEMMKKEEEEKKRKEELMKKKQQEEFERRKQLLIKEQQLMKMKKKEEQLQLPPHIKRKMERAQMIFKKAQGLEQKGKIEKAIERYSFLIDLYSEIENEIGEKIPEKNKIINILSSLKK